MNKDLRHGGLTVLREPTWSTAGVYALFLLLGAGLGGLVGPLADWLLTLPWTPVQGPASLAASIPLPWLPIAGAAAGLLLGLIAHHEQLTIRLTNDHVRLTSHDRKQEFPRAAVALACRDGRQLVLLGHDGGELARQKCDLDFDRIAEAFALHGYTWTDADPYRDEFHLWVPGAHGLPRGANAILKARQKLLDDENSSFNDLQKLREELSRLGVVVRDEKHRQYWRMFRR